MQLKNYQKNVLNDLARFLTIMTESGKASVAYSTLWDEKNVNVGLGGMPYYQDTLNGVPSVCFKVPTGGGKTFIAANSIKVIYDAMPAQTAKAVVWLVPSDAILTQTYAALSNAQHPYRERIDTDFGGAVEVYSKAQLLNGQNFNPTAVTEQLSIFVLSYDSFRTKNKEGRKAYQENGNLALFPKLMQDKSALLPDTDETALIQVIRSLNPVVIVDESHHATSSLSVEMIENFNPCFVLDLTATPKDKSNIISFVDAKQLKAENMVKLPVIVYNRKKQEDVYADAIHLRCKLEAQARNEQQTTGRYIRPIVLFQAQPRTGAESTTYDKIKQTLIDAGIPANEIAIKTGDKDELKNVDLMSPDCAIRYIITVNALKEGWDCPFAYILATVANRTSSVDVEQILGRVLRLPYTKKNASNVLNISYVITSSSDFGNTLEKVVKGLNNAGFTDKDCRARDVEPEATAAPEPAPIQTEMPIEAEPDIPEVDTTSLRNAVEQAVNTQGASTQEIESDELLSTALAQNEQYEQQVFGGGDTVIDTTPVEVRSRMNVFRMNEEYAEEAIGLRLPQFMFKTEVSFFAGDYITLKQEHLEEGFTLRDKDVQIDFSTMEAEMARVDTDDGSGAVPKVWRVRGTDNAYYKEWFNAQPSEVRLRACKDTIKSRLARFNCIDYNELKDYVDRVVDTLNEDQISDMEQSVYPYVLKIEQKVKDLLAAHRANMFDLWLEQGKIECRPNYALSPTISPTNYTTIFPHSLYSGEEDVNEYERAAIMDLSSMGNIKWWHRNISRVGFNINGSINAYPDIIAMTTGGKILLIETKGDHLDNAESQAKAKLGHQWDMLAGQEYRYFMVFQTRSPGYPGAYSYERFMEIVRGL